MAVQQLAALPGVPPDCARSSTITACLGITLLETYDALRRWTFVQIPVVLELEVETAMRPRRGENGHVVLVR
jgi:hypothetical protein